MLGMMPPSKKIASIILSSKGLDGKENEETLPEVPSDDSVATEAAAEKIMKALEAKDKKALAEGLKDFLAICEMEEEQEEPMMEGLE